MEELFSDVNSRFRDYFHIQSKFWFWRSRLALPQKFFIKRPWIGFPIVFIPVYPLVHLVGFSFWLPRVFSYSFILKRHVWRYILPALYHILWEAIRAVSSAEEINQALRTSHMVTADISFSESTGKTSCIYILFTEKEGLHGQSWRFTIQVSLLWFPYFIFYDLEMSNGLSLGPYGAGPHGFMKWQ